MTSRLRRPLNTLRGVILGTMVGDTIGLPYEGLSARRVSRWAPSRLRQAFVWGRGMVSDDTEHTVIVGRALAHTHTLADYRLALARGLRRWLRTLPGGVGLATLRALLRLNLGVPPHRSGVHSAGNGPAMRAALLGVCVPREELVQYVDASTTLTHTDPRAASGALAVALAAHFASHGQSGRALIESVAAHIDEPELRAALHSVATHTDSASGLRAYLAENNLEHGVSGFVMHTVPVALLVAATAPSVESAVTQAVRLGGDTDSVGAITGAITGARFGADAIPADWVAGLLDWPLSVARLDALATSLHEGTPPPPYRYGAATLRNLLVFMPLVLAHGFRRLAPPW